MPIQECTLPDGRKRYKWGGDATLRLALDKSTRVVDADGRLHVGVSNISKAMVSEYHASEIPNAEALGLNMNKVYRLLRDPEELKKSVSTWNGIQVLYRHQPVSAQDPQKDLIVGTTGTDSAFVDPYLQNSLTIWDAVAIAGIESLEQTELSCGYRYVADMTPGVFDGKAYDGVMREIVGNHVAIVEKGRAGPDVVVGDSHPSKRTQDMKKAPSKKTVAVRAALKAFLRPMLAQDSALDINAIVGNDLDPTRIAKIIMAKATFAEDADPKDEDIAGVVKEAADETEEDKKDDAAGGRKANKELDREHPDREGEDDEDGGYVLDRILKVLEGKVPADVLDAVRAAAKKPAEDESEEETHRDDAEGGRKANVEEGHRKAMDAAIKLAQDATVARMNGIAEAKEVVQPLVGKVGAMDSAEAVYKFALDHLQVDVKDVHPSAYRSLVLAHMPKPKLAHDSAGISEFAKQFPGLKMPERM